MLISVVISAFNEEDDLGETLAALERGAAFLLSKEDLSVEVVVVDDDSLDATADVARR